MTIDIEALKATLRTDIASSGNELLKQVVAALTALQGQIQVLTDENKDLERDAVHARERAGKVEDKLYTFQSLNDFEKVGIFPGTTRPADGQRVNYFFEPFGRWYTGTYYAQGDSVSGSGGFSSWLPEVLLWSINNSKDDSIVINSLIEKIEKLNSDQKRFKVLENAYASKINYDVFFNAADATIDQSNAHNFETRNEQSVEQIIREWRTIGIHTRRQTGKTQWAKRLLSNSGDFALVCTGVLLNQYDMEFRVPMEQVFSAIDLRVLAFKYIIIDDARTPAGISNYEQLVSLLVENFAVNPDVRIIKLG